MQELFRDPKFLQAATEVCPTDKPHLDPFQFNFIIQIPGQTVATHIDGAYFWGATRFQFPQWLLAAMTFSGLWKDRFVDQVQVVAYYHEWDPTILTGNGVDAGEFLYWNDPLEKTKAPKAVTPYPRAGSSVDGSKTVHAANVYRNDIEPPYLDKDAENVLRYQGATEADHWILQAGDHSYNYSTNDLRMSVVYRARCFENADAARRFNGTGGPEEELLTLDEILVKFTNDLHQRGVLTKTVEEALDPSPETRLELALNILDTYIKYPEPTNPIIPYNYCALDRLLPTLKPLMQLIC